MVGYTDGNLDGTNQGDHDAILRRYNGGKLWGLQFGTGLTDRAHKVATDGNGNVYVLGQTAGPLGLQVKGLDVFLAKFNQDGKRVWIRQFGTKNTDRPAGLAIDSNNRIYVLSDEGLNNFVIRKFGMGGGLLKTKSVTLNTYPNLTPEAIAVDSSNRVIVLTNWFNNNNGDDIRLFKYTSSLSQVWQKNYGTPAYETAFGITTDNNNNIYFTLLNDEARLVKKNAKGKTIYSKRLDVDVEYKPTDTHGYTCFESITTDSSNNIYIAGYTTGSFPGFSNSSNTGVDYETEDIVVLKYNSSGIRQWLTQFDGGNYGSADPDLALDIAVNGTVYITGYTNGNLLSGGTISYGFADAYVAKLSKSNGTILGVDQ